MRTTVCWIARLVSLLALLTWGRMAQRSRDHPETWQQSERRTYTFVVMVGAGVASLPSPKPGAKGTRRRERF